MKLHDFEKHPLAGVTKSVAAAFRDRMEKTGMTEKTLAKQVGCSRSGIYGVVNAKAIPSREFVRRLAAVLGVEVKSDILSQFREPTFDRIGHRNSTGRVLKPRHPSLRAPVSFEEARQSPGHPPQSPEALQSLTAEELGVLFLDVKEEIKRRVNTLESLKQYVL